MACTPQDLVTAASKFQGIPTGMQTNIATAVACQLAGIPADPQALVEASKCIECGKTEPILLAIAAVCNLSSSGPTFSIVSPSDPDAFTFWVAWVVRCFTDGGCTIDSSSWSAGQSIDLPTSCATVCNVNQTTTDGVNNLVTQLKAAGLWDLMDVIYPFLGGDASSCSLNLKDTTKFAITWHGGVTFSSSGATGDGSTGYGDTGYNPVVNGVNYTLNSGSMGVYLSTIGSVGGPIIGASDGSVFSNNASMETVSTGATTFGLNASQERSVIAPETSGNFAATVTGVAQRNIYSPGGNASDSSAPISTGVPNSNFFVMHTVGAGTGNLFNNSRLSFAFVGSGFSGAQITTLNGIVNTFVASK